MCRVSRDPVAQRSRAGRGAGQGDRPGGVGRRDHDLRIGHRQEADQRRRGCGGFQRGHGVHQRVIVVVMFPPRKVGIQIRQRPASRFAIVRQSVDGRGPQNTAPIRHIVEARLNPFLNVILRQNIHRRSRWSDGEHPVSRPLGSGIFEQILDQHLHVGKGQPVLHKGVQFAAPHASRLLDPGSDRRIEQALVGTDGVSSQVFKERL